MQVKISSIDIYKADIPFKLKFRHSSKERDSSESVFIKLRLSDGTVGFGESLPRAYVTGEDQDSVVKRLRKVLPERFAGKAFECFDDVVRFLMSVDDINCAAKCVIELALLDAAGKAFGCSVSDGIGKGEGSELIYSGVISGDSLAKLALSAVKYRFYGLRHIKAKVGSAEDAKRLSLIRLISGSRADIRVDANGVWGADEAIVKMSRLSRYRISAVEQPVGKDDPAGLKKVSENITEPVMADESLCTKQDAERLISERACKMFNIRLSKCGGILDSIEIAGMARKAGIAYQIGCQVGESGILSAAGRHFAACVDGIRYLEGSYGNRLLFEDVVREKILFGRGGVAGQMSGFGLGVTVDEERLEKYITERVELKC